MSDLERLQMWCNKVEKYKGKLKDKDIKELIKLLKGKQR